MAKTTQDRSKHARNIELAETAAEGRITEAFELAKFGADLNFRDQFALRRAVVGNHALTANMLIDLGARPQANLTRMIFHTIKLGNSSTLEKLLEFNSSRVLLNTALCKAARYGNQDVIRVLLERGADVAGKNNEPVRIAARHGHTDALRVFVEFNAELDAGTPTPLMEAVKHSQVETVRFLCKFDINVRGSKDIIFKTAWKKINFEILDILLQFPAESEEYARERLSNLASIGHASALSILFDSEMFAPDYQKTLDELLQHAGNFGDLSIEKWRVCQNLIERGAQFPEKFSDYGRGESTEFLELVRPLYRVTGDFHHRLQALNTFTEIPRDQVTFDALDKRLPWCEQPIVKVALRSAYIAVCLAKNGTLQKYLLRALLKNDAQTILQTEEYSWRSYLKILDQNIEQIKDVNDVLSEVKAAFVLPSVAMKLEGPPKTWNYHDVTEGSKAVARDYLLSGKSTFDVLRLTRMWHKQYFALPAHLRPLKKGAEWHPLFNPVETSKGFSVSCLTTDKQLSAEGEQLDHCVGRASTLVLAKMEKLTSFPLKIMVHRWLPLSCVSTLERRRSVNRFK